MLQRKLAVAIVASLLGLHASSESSVLADFLGATRQVLGNVANVVAGVLLDQDGDLLGDSICVRARPKARKPGGMKSIPVAPHKEDPEEQIANVVVAKQHLKSITTCRGYDSDDERSSVGYNGSQGISPSATPPLRPQTTSPAASDDQFAQDDDARSRSVESTQAKNAITPHLVRHGTEQFIDLSS